MGLIGAYADSRLEMLPSSLLSWSDFAEAHPEATVVDRHTGHDRPYGRNPYPGWDRMQRNPFLGASQPEPCNGARQCLDPKERIGVVTVSGESVVYPFARVAAAGGVLQDRVGGVPIVVWWRPDVQSVLDNKLLSRNDEVGTLVAFDRRVNGITLDLEQRGDALIERGTGRSWDVLGRLRSGGVTPDLSRVQIDTPYWFAFAAFGSGYRVWGS